jgi:hypothetical protein
MNVTVMQWSLTFLNPLGYIRKLEKGLTGQMIEKIVMIFNEIS